MSDLARVKEIETLIAEQKMTVHQCFTQMKQLVYRQAPCHAHCESNAYEIAIRQYKTDIDSLKQENKELKSNILLDKINLQWALGRENGLKSDIKKLVGLIEGNVFDNLQLKAHVERLREALIQRDGGAHDTDCLSRNGRACNCCHDAAIATLNATPKQSLYLHDVDVIYKAIDTLRESDHIHNDNGYEHIYIKTLEEYADQLRINAGGTE